MIHCMPGGALTLKTDISQFYASIYTHAVDWAIRGKGHAKKNMRAKVFGALLDKALRDARDGQTIGVSIGPDTSWLIAEVLLARIDFALCAQFQWVAERAVRFGDDLTVYPASRMQASEVLGRYEQLLRDYELSLNPNKIQIIDGLEPPEERWVTRLRQLRYRDSNDRLLSQDIVDLFASALDLVPQFPTSGVLGYAIKRCDPFPAGPDSWSIYRDFVLASVSQEPSALGHAYDVLRFARHHGLEVQTARVEQLLNNLCTEHARLDHGYEVAWVLEILRELELPLDVEAARAISGMNDNCSLLLLIAAVQNSSTLKQAVDLSFALSRAEAVGALSTSDWLLAYECRRNRWCRPSRWDRSAAWKELNHRKVRFFEYGQQPRRIRLKRRAPAFMSSWAYT